MPDSRDLEAFLAVADELNFTRAAERLLVAQPALSSRIRRLERELGAQLFERTTRSVTLTHAGAVLADYGGIAMSVLDQAWLMARRAGEGMAGQVRIAYGPSTGGETVPVLMEHLAELHPSIEVVAAMMPSAHAVRAVMTAAADLALVRGRPDGRDLHVVAARIERRGVLVPLDHPLAASGAVSLADVARWPVLLHAREENPAHHDEVRALFAAADLAVQFHQPTATHDPGQHVIRSRKAVGLVGESARSALPADLVWVPLSDPGSEVVVHLVSAERQVSPAQRLIHDAVLAVAHDLGWLPRLDTMLSGDPARPR